jgi:hypothetical protein
MCATLIDSRQVRHGGFPGYQPSPTTHTGYSCVECRARRVSPNMIDAYDSIGPLLDPYTCPDKSSSSASRDVGRYRSNFVSRNKSPFRLRIRRGSTLSLGDTRTRDVLNGKPETQFRRSARTRQVKIYNTKIAQSWLATP